MERASISIKNGLKQKYSAPYSICLKDRLSFKVQLALQEHIVEIFNEHRAEEVRAVAWNHVQHENTIQPQRVNKQLQILGVNFAVKTRANVGESLRAAKNAHAPRNKADKRDHQQKREPVDEEHKKVVEQNVVGENAVCADIVQVFRLGD